MPIRSKHFRSLTPRRSDGYRDFQTAPGPFKGRGPGAFFQRFSIIFSQFSKCGLNRGLDLPKPTQNHVKAIPGHTAFDPKSMVHFAKIEKI